MGMGQNMQFDPFKSRFFGTDRNIMEHFGTSGGRFDTPISIQKHDLSRFWTENEGSVSPPSSNWAMGHMFKNGLARLRVSAFAISGVGGRRIGPVTGRGRIVS